jgi:hypothetical protein
MYKKITLSQPEELDRNGGFFTLISSQNPGFATWLRPGILQPWRHLGFDLPQLHGVERQEPRCPTVSPRTARHRGIEAVGILAKRS